MIVGTLLVRRDRPSFPEWFSVHLQRLMPLIDHLYVRIDKTGGDVVPFLEPYGAKVHWDYQYDHPKHTHMEDRERQALLAWALSTGARWCFAFDSDEVLEEGAAEVLREFVSSDANPYRILLFPLTYSSHHRPGYLLDRDETSVSVGRGFRLDDPEIAEYHYVGDKDGLHCGTLPSQDKRAAVMKEIQTVHYHATTSEEWEFKRGFYEDTWHVGRFGGIEHLYPLCGDPPYACDRFGKEANARPYEEVVVGQEERFARLMRRLDRVPA